MSIKAKSSTNKGLAVEEQTDESVKRRRHSSAGIRKEMHYPKVKVSKRRGRHVGNFKEEKIVMTLRFLNSRIR